MMFRRRLSSVPSTALLFSLVFLAPSADKNEAAAAAFNTNVVACSNITDAESGTTFEVCAVGKSITPNPAPNGSSGGFSDTFWIVPPGYAEGSEFPPESASRTFDILEGVVDASLMTVKTSLDEDGNCQVRVHMP